MGMKSGDESCKIRIEATVQNTISLGLYRKMEVMGKSLGQVETGVTVAYFQEQANSTGSSFISNSPSSSTPTSICYFG